MAEQGRIVMPTVGATGSRGRLTSNTLKLHNTCNKVSCAVLDPGRMRLAPQLHPSGSGYTSNQRPALGYRPSLDLIDNPQFGLLLSDSFMSQTKWDYRPQIHAGGSESLVNIINKPRQSGFLHLGCNPQAVSLEEKTEYLRSFVHHRPTPTVSLQKHVALGPKHETGFTRGNTSVNKTSCMVEPRRTQDSVMKSDFLPPSHLQGPEVIPSLRSHSCQESGFTRGSVAPLACPTSLLPSPQTKTTAPTLTTIGKKESSGFLLNAPNNNAFPNTPFDSSHFITHYESMFSPHADFRGSSLKLRSSQTGAGVICTKMDNGYNRRDMDRFIIEG